jgi:serine protease AprX
MCWRLEALSLSFLLGLILLPCTTHSSESHMTAGALTSQAIERNRLPQTMGPRFMEYLTTRPATSVKVWVFFTDKALSGKAGFEAAAGSVTLTERALRRRTKVGMDRVVFADLPVAAEYVDAITSRGAQHRRSSRWLNAASFEMPASLVLQISQLPFVAEIRPVMQARRQPDEQMEVRPSESEEAQSTDALNYGISYAQLNQIGVPAVHNRGYSGQGVTLASLDTGVRKDHLSIAAHFAEGRVLAEYDFVHNDGNVDNEPGDLSTERNHGTQVFAIAGGYHDGYMYGPAYRANFILCKTENLRSELPVEEDNWVAGMEFADSVGADVITSSLGYLEFDDSCHCDYSFGDMDGQTATTSIAASMADGLGIVLTKSAGNSGPSAGTITAPADAFDILAVGSVGSTGVLATTSSRGPTADGRIKPEVCARGVSTYTASPSATTNNDYTSPSGTSFAAPLVAGAACLLIEAHPEWTPAQVREALKASGDRAATPDNNYGWGIINVEAALALGPDCCTGVVGNADGAGDDEPTLGDIMALVEFLFVNHQPPTCMAEADVNQSGGISPLSHDITLGDIMRLVDHLYISQAALPNCM